MADKCIHGKLIDYEDCLQCDMKNKTRAEIEDQGITLSSILREVREIKNILLVMTALERVKASSTKSR